MVLKMGAGQSLQRLFCEIGNDCRIPPILFIDQPTQVYFPNINRDTGDKFNVKDLINPSKAQNIDEDIKSVERFFSELINFSSKTLEETGIEPQIIITDHADDLKLENELVFENYVRAKWRSPGDGLIKLKQ